MNVNPMASSVIYQQSETSIADSNFKSELAKNNVLYQILDSLFVHARIPHIFNFILLLWNTLQIITITFWIPHTNVFLSVHDVNDSNPQNVAIATKVVRYFNAVANLRPLHNSDFELLICVVIYSLVFLLSLGHLIFQIICAKNRGRLINSSLFSTRIFLQFVPGIMNMPTAAMCGTCFRLMLKKDPPIQTYFFFVLLLIQFIYYFLVFSQFFKFMSASVYLNDSCLASFNLSNYSSLISSSAAVQLFAYMFQVFPQWAIYFIVVIHLLVCGLSVPGNLNCMMIHVAANIEILALSATLAEMDIFRIVVIFIKNLPDYVYLIVLAVLLIINFTWSTFYYVSRNKKISNEVKRVISEYSEEDLKKEEIKFLIFEDDFNLGKSESHAINYLNCIVTNYYYQFLDFTIIKYITQTFKSTKTLHYCAKIVAYFPCYTSYLNMLFGELIKRKDLSNDIKFCLFEIQRVKINRTSSSSAAVAESLKMLIQNGREIESNIKHF
ncbi:hypothetical protein TRFO_10469 [Tritrichomonas foetus]|uniref:Uncharacterized protein n=1 Tax=Tritrichomonas foetus TaxID=1144522 RepID=A0A1J4J8Q8_9EUKA|nr:hypothetical protein TRFO_10469 [Tritrichomonas foetus]|eukprot:OHS95570.1 hypothetical protein TRFO_10469 [Tritrichomonas foetus]